METLDKGRSAHLFKLGIVSALLALAADMILGWGVADESLTGLDQYFSRYLTVSDTRIVLSAVLGMIGITVETLCCFGVYRLIASRSGKLAHAYRAGLIGMTAFGPFTHVMCCASIYHLNALNKFDPSSAAEGAVKFIICFLIPVTAVFFPFFLTVAIVQFKAFLKNETPYPKWCCIFFYSVRTSRSLTDQADRKLPGCICNIDRLDKYRKSYPFHGPSYQHEESGDVIYG